MKKQSNKKDIIRIRKIIITVLIIILSFTLINSFVSYKKTTKKIEAKESMMDLILTIEAIEINESIEFDDSDTIANIKNENGNKLKAIVKYGDIEDLNKIEDLSFGDARKIINNEVDFVINKEGQFLRID